MATEKVSLTLDERVLREARRRAGRKGLSAYVNDVLAQRLQAERLGTLLREYDATFGPVPDSIRKEVDREWDEAERRLRRRRSRSSSTPAR